MLYIVPTPIGNLKDITYRAVEVLSSSDYILCEDTRHSQVLLQHYQIQKPLKSYHLFNEAKHLAEIVNDLRLGKNIALISDGGTPGLCDPGQRLIQKCREENLPYTSLPGACAAITALALSGLEMQRFQFLGFFPRKDKDQKALLHAIACYQGTSICYESPVRIVETLALLSPHVQGRKMIVVREISKTFEEVLDGSAQELITHFEKHPPKGEIVFLVGPDQEDRLFLEMDVKELLEELQSVYGLSLSEAIKAAAHLRKEPKQAIYKSVHKQT